MKTPQTKFGRRGDRLLFTIRKTNNYIPKSFNPVAIFELPSISEIDVSYNYTVSENTHKHKDFTQITKKEFLQRVKDMQKKHGVKFTIKY